MTVRLGFAVASCIEPDILLVDEVLAVGDAAFRHKCLGRIKGLLKDGTSLIFVSHDLGLVKAVCETALYLDHGRMQQFGTTAEIIESVQPGPGAAAGGAAAGAGGVRRR